MVPTSTQVDFFNKLEALHYEPYFRCFGVRVGSVTSAREMATHLHLRGLRVFNAFARSVLCQAQTFSQEVFLELQEDVAPFAVAWQGQSDSPVGIQVGASKCSRVSSFQLHSLRLVLVSCQSESMVDFVQGDYPGHHPHARGLALRTGCGNLRALVTMALRCRVLGTPKVASFVLLYQEQKGTL